MNDSWHENLKLFLVHRFPLFATFILIFLFSVPIYSIEMNYFRPMVWLICVYYWSLKTPQMFSYISAFCVGFWVDAYSSAPLGVNILLLMLLVYTTSYLERYIRSSVFGLVWASFGVVSFGFIALKWLVLTIYFGHIFSFEEIILCYLTTLLFYPLIAAINGWVQHTFLIQENINE